MEKLDYKKVYKELYQPPAKPTIVNVPDMVFIAVEGSGDPNISAEYREALEILYGLSFSIKMSKMNGTQPEGYFEYVVPPLEGLWWVDSAVFDGTNVTCKDDFRWISMIRQPDFVTEDVLERAGAALLKKRPQLDLSKARLMSYSEGLCVQIMHKGPYDDEPASIAAMKQYLAENGYTEDISDKRLHHEIYLSDPRRTAPEKLKTVIRHPIRPLQDTEAQQNN